MGGTGSTYSTSYSSEGQKSITLQVCNEGGCHSGVVYPDVIAQPPQLFEPTVIGAMAELANLRYKTLYGLTLGEDYLFNGNKHLAYISGGHLGVGIDLYIDIDDYYTVMHPEDPITGEGAKQPEHWVTVWVDGKIGLGAGLPGSFGLVRVPRITFEDDPRRKWNVSGPGATLGPIVKVKWFEFTDQGFDWGKTDWFESVGIDFSIASLSGNVARFEIKKDVLDLIIADAFSPVPGVIGGVVLNNFASNLIASLIGVESDNGQLTVGGTWISSIGFDSVRAFTVSDAPGGPATFGGTIDYVWGGLDIDGDGRPDNYYPVVPDILGIPFWGQRLDICFRNIGSEPASYFVRLVGDLPPGWMVVADDGTDLPLLIDKKYDVPDVSPNQPYNDCNNTKWVVAATKDAAEFAKVTFELHQDKFLTNPLQDTVEVTLRKGEEISDPSPDPTPTPTPEPEKDGFDFTSGEDGGSGFFSQSVPQNGRAIVGAIPAGITNLFVELDAENDLDIELWDGDTFVVGWVADGEQAQIFSSTEITGDYNGVTITWSGWDGTNGNRGDEFMQINGTTQNEFVMKVFGFEAGTVAANYSWGSSGGSGSFSQEVLQNARAVVGTIPTGISNLSVTLDAQNDLDIELWDGDTFVVGWVADGVEARISSPNEITGEYNGVTITWSGWDGTNGNLGDEFIQIMGTTQNEFVMKVFGFEAGTVFVDYSWGP